jgi:hypothetical protein
MNIFRFFEFRRGQKQIQTLEPFEPSPQDDQSVLPHLSVRPHRVIDVVEGRGKSYLFIQPFGNAFKRGSTYVTDGKAYGDDLLDGMTPEQVEQTIRMVGSELSPADNTNTESNLMVMRTGDDQPDSPFQVEARRRRFASVFSKIVSKRDARSEDGK